jgi:hypothetical protein
MTTNLLSDKSTYLVEVYRRKFDQWVTQDNKLFKTLEDANEFARANFPNEQTRVLAVQTLTRVVAMNSGKWQGE